MAANGWVSFDSIDINLVPWSEKFYFKDTASPLVFEDLTAEVQALATVYDASTGSQIINTWLHIPFLPTGLKTAPGAGINNSIGGLIKFATALAGEPYSYWLPGLVAAAYDSSHPNLLATGSAPLSNLITELTTAHGTITWTDEDFNSLATEILKAIKSVRKQRRALGRAR